MTQVYEATYKALSPIHIGYRSIGILDTTRYYVTGKAVWGAITAAATRCLLHTPRKEEYECVGEIVRKNIRTTYFFPKVDSTVYSPAYEEGGLQFGTSGKVLSKNAFEKTFIHSFVSTALDRTKTADENTLHEIEYIKNRVRMTDSVKEVYWVGYLLVNDGPFSAEKNGKKVDLEVETGEGDFTIKEGDRRLKASEMLGEIQVGGERNYGFGNLRLEGKFLKADHVFGCKLAKDRVKSETALGHVYFDNLKHIGEVEPFIGREWGEKGSGRDVSLNKKRENTPCVFFVPGTRFGGELKFEVREYGMMQKTKNGEIRE